MAKKTAFQKIYLKFKYNQGLLVYIPFLFSLGVNSSSFRFHMVVVNGYKNSLAEVMQKKYLSADHFANYFLRNLKKKV